MSRVRMCTSFLQRVMPTERPATLSLCQVNHAVKTKVGDVGVDIFVSWTPLQDDALKCAQLVDGVPYVPAEHLCACKAIIGRDRDGTDVRALLAAAKSLDREKVAALLRDYPEGLQRWKEWSAL